jgi:hypothetical protein
LNVPIVVGKAGGKVGMVMLDRYKRAILYIMGVRVLCPLR